MINHLRTLLLNRDSASQAGPDYPGEQYVPTYAARQLPAALQITHRLLFGSNPDRALMNWRLQEFLAILHGSEMEQAVLDLDPRITYKVDDPQLYNLVKAGPVAQKSNITLGDVQVILAPNNTDGIYFQWDVNIVGVITVNMTTIASPSGSKDMVQSTFSVTNGLSSPVLLGGSPYSVRFNPVTGYEWTITLVAPPVRKLIDVYNDVSVGLSSDVADELFSNVEPYLSFKRLWENSPHPSYRLGGVVLALGYRINELVP